MGLSNKLMGQVNLVRSGRQSINDRRSFTLTSGVLSQEPMKGSTSVSMVNAGVEAFVRAAALESREGFASTPSVSLGYRNVARAENGPLARHACRRSRTSLSRERRRHGDWANHRSSQARGEIMAV